VLHLEDRQRRAELADHDGVLRLHLVDAVRQPGRMDRGLVLHGLDQLAALGVDLLARRGQTLAPASVFVCGLVIALGNCASNGLPSRVILLSSAVLAQYFLNVPLTTMMLTHGTGLMFLLWHLTPREIFRLGASSPAEKPR